MALRQAGTQTAVADICRKLWTTEPTFYRWKREYAELGVSEIRRLRQVVADLTVDKAVLQDVVRRKWRRTCRPPMG